MALIYKIVSAGAWQDAVADGEFRGAAIDLQDGFIHFSAADQVQETAARHFSGARDLVLVAVDSGSLAGDLKWEPSRGGALFPHLYGNLPIRTAVWVKPLPLGADGYHQFPDLGTAP